MVESKKKKVNNMIFKINDRVYDISFGWGTIEKIENKGNYPLNVRFDGNFYIHRYTVDGVSELIKGNPTLSFIDYSKDEEFSQKRNDIRKNHIGKYCKFWDDNNPTELYIAILEDVGECGFAPEGNDPYDNCELLSDKLLEELGLKNETY